MPSSISASLEPGLERGVPWGRDLYTFVTSAAGHMMRTLQKPQKNRPSKRQVNHRRFLHNMIQRKFADIEAANHRLASALYFKDGEKNLLPVSSHKSKSPDSSDDMCQSDSLPESDKCSRQTADVSKSRSDDLVDLQGVRENIKNQADLKDLSQYHEPSACATKLNHQSDDLSSYNPPKVTECYHTIELFHSDCSPKKSQPTLSANTQFSQKDSSSMCCENQNDDISLSFSSELSPLSFSIQAFTEESGCTQVQKSGGETSLPDIADLFSVSKKDSSVFMEVEACFENFCDAELDVYAEDGFSLLDLADNFTTGEDVHSYSWDGGQGLTANCIQNNQRTQSKCLHSKNTDLMQNQLHTSHYDVTPLEMYQSCQEESPSMLLSCENNTSFTSFEGVAQSFTAPPHPPFHRPIATPPQEDDWMFTNILTDKKFFFF